MLHYKVGKQLHIKCRTKSRESGRYGIFCQKFGVGGNEDLIVFTIDPTKKLYKESSIQFFCGKSSGRDAPT